LEEALAAYSEVLNESNRERVPLNWALAQNNLGIALRRLGERESNIKRLNEAVKTHRRALEEWKRDHMPLKWAEAQKDLSSALNSLRDLITRTT
jgi:tetratricopeptide (TPR) repeat protein